VLLGSYGSVDLEKDIQQTIEWYIKSQTKNRKTQGNVGEGDNPEKEGKNEADLERNLNVML
jgi:hypothetical protein